MDLSKKERQQLRLEKLREESLEAQKEHDADQQLHENRQNELHSSRTRKLVIAGVVGLVLVIGIVSFSLLSSASEGQFDSFAKCLSEKGAIVYGNDFCSYTQKQLSWFGKSRKYLNYVKCAENKELCNSKGVKVTPTWEINGQTYGEVQTFEKLSAVSGCSIFIKQ